MSDLPNSDLRRFSAALELLYEPVGIENLPRRLFAVIESLFPDAFVSFEDIDFKTGTHSASLNFQVPHEEDYRASLAINLPRDHPGVAYNLANPGAPMRLFRLSDLVSQRQFRQTGLYWDQFKPVGAKYQMVVIPDVSSHLVGVAINREKDFSSREAELVRLLSPHIIRAHFNAKLFTELQRNQQRHSQEFSPEALLRRGITPREAEVIQWLIEGKRNSEIAIILGASPRTIAKHVEHIIGKLGVETRTAAAKRASELLQ